MPHGVESLDGAFVTFLPNEYHDLRLEYIYNDLRSAEQVVDEFELAKEELWLMKELEAADKKASLQEKGDVPAPEGDEQRLGDQGCGTDAVRRAGQGLGPLNELAHVYGRSTGQGFYRASQVIE